MSDKVSDLYLHELKALATCSAPNRVVHSTPLISICDELLEYRKKAKMAEAAEEPIVGPTWGVISLVQLEKARKDYAAGEPKDNAEFAAQSLESEVRYLKEKLKQAENDRDFALDALADIAKGMELCTPYPAATKRIVLAEYERLKKAAQIPCGTGEVRND